MSPDIDPADLEELARRVDGVVGDPASAVAAEAARVFSPPARDRRAAVSVRAAHHDDVAAVVRWAGEVGRRVSARAGGHSFDGFPVDDGVVLLDLRDLAGTELRPDGRAVIGGGAIGHQAATLLAPAGRALPVGECPTVGVGGLLTGGGFGHLSQIAGLTCDALREATVVVGDGSTVVCGPDRDADLFWACRGGGGAAGIVTSFTMATWPIHRVTLLEIIFAWEGAREVLRVYDRVVRSAPATLDLTWRARTTGPDRFLDSASTGPPGTTPGRPHLLVEGRMFGAPGDARDLVAPLLALDGVESETIEEVDYFEALLAENPVSFLSDPAPATLRGERVASDIFDGELTEDEADAVIDFVDALQGDDDLHGGAALLEPTRGAICDLDVDATAFPHRRADVLAEWELFGPVHASETLVARHDALLDDLRRRLGRLLTGGRYLNYADRLDTPDSWWGPNLARLERVVGDVDPDGVIRSRLRP